MNALHERLNSIKNEKILLHYIEAKLLAELKKGHTYVKETLAYIKYRKTQLALEEAKLLVQIKRIVTA